MVTSGQLSSANPWGNRMFSDNYFIPRYVPIRGKIVDVQWLQQVINARVYMSGVRAPDPNFRPDAELIELMRSAINELLTLE